MKEYDVVVLTQDIPDLGLVEGARGTIVLVLRKPKLTYEVEFCDEAGRTIAQVALPSDQIKKAGVARYILGAPPARGVFQCGRGSIARGRRRTP